VLGEDLIAFRDSNSKVGLLANRCPHRGRFAVLWEWNLVPEGHVYLTKRVADSNWIQTLEHGAEPPGVARPEVYRLRSASVVLPRTGSWIEDPAPFREARPGVNFAAV